MSNRHAPLHTPQHNETWSSFVPCVCQVLDHIFSPVYLLRALLSHKQTNAHETICEQETLHILPKTQLSPHTLFAYSFPHLFHLIFFA